MPISEQRVRHLLRRTEFVDEQARVTELTALNSIEDAVDNVLGISAPSVLPLGNGENWEQGQSLTRAWLDQMATTARPMRERMAFFWHGHICSELGKVNSAPFMAEQIELFRRDGLNGNLSQLLKDMSAQVAMLRYLDNDRNRLNSPNQNFAREMMELFTLGVGNYTEADVEAATAAWTGWFVDWDAPGGVSANVVEFRWEAHHPSILRFLGVDINDRNAVSWIPGTSGYENPSFETIDVILGTGRFPGGGSTPNGNSRAIAARFLSKKLWQEFGEANSGDVPAGVLADMTAALLDNDFDIRPWVRAMLVHPDFYPDTNSVVDGGLVRQPVEYMVSLMVATGRTADDVASLWLMDQAGQELLYPPNVSGWKPNGFWVNASAFEARNRIAEGVIWTIFDDYWEHPWEERYKNFIQLPGGKIYADEIIGPATEGPFPPWHPRLSNDELVDKCLDYMDLNFSADSRQALIDFCESHTSAGDPNYHERRQVPLLIMLAPEMHIN